MQWLNYQHLYYFWVVAREGSMTAAARQLRLAQPTLSTQIQALENALGTQLFERKGGRLILTDTGRRVQRRADEIFTLGRDLVEMVAEDLTQRRRFRVGIAGLLPKLLVHRLLEPALHEAEPVALVCREGKHADLLARLAVGDLDLVLTQDAGREPSVRVFNHLLGESDVSVFAARPEAPRFAKNFPDSLDRAPFLLPLEGMWLRRSINDWFAERKLTPTVVGEMEDSALIKVFGQAGWGLFAMPSVEEPEILRQYDVQAVGRLTGVRVRFYAVSTERKVTHPLVRLILEKARDAVFE